MKKILFLIISPLILNMESVFAEGDYRFIDEGYYTISLKDTKEGQSISSNNVYIQRNKKDCVFMYTNSGNRFIIKANGEMINSKFESNKTAVTLEGEITSKNTIQGKYIIIKLKTGKKKELFFSLIPNMSPRLKNADFIRIFNTAQKRRNKWVIPKDTTEGQRIRKKVEAKAKKCNMYFTILGKIVNEQNQPLSNATVKINILKIDPDGKLGGKMQQRSIVTDTNGKFSIQSCFGVSANIYVKKQGFCDGHKQINGPVGLKKNIGKTITIKLKSDNQAVQVKSPSSTL